MVVGLELVLSQFETCDYLHDIGTSLSHFIMGICVGEGVCEYHNDIPTTLFMTQ